MGFGECLRFLREESGMTQAEVAEKLGTSRALVAMYEVGAKVPNVNLAAKIASMFGVTVDQMMNFKKGGSQ